MAGTKWIRFYHAMVASPLGSRDICYAATSVWTSRALGHGGAAFLIVAAVLGALAVAVGDARRSPPPC